MKPKREEDQRNIVQDRRIKQRTVILEISRLGGGGSEGNFISLFEDRGLVLADLDTIDLHMKRDADS